jgi:hypothetical protein
MGRAAPATRVPAKGGRAWLGFAPRSAGRVGPAASAIAGEAKTREADAHHRPGPGLRCGAARQRDAVEERNRRKAGRAPSERNTNISEADVAVKVIDPVINPVNPRDPTSAVVVSWVSPPSETTISFVVARSGRPRGP